MKKCNSYTFLKLCAFFFVDIYLQRYAADIGKAWPVLIVCGGIIPLILSVIWLAMIQRLVAAMTWITVVLFDILVISVTMFFYLKGLLAL